MWIRAGLGQMRFEREADRNDGDGGAFSISAV